MAIGFHVHCWKCKEELAIAQKAFLRHKWFARLIPRGRALLGPREAGARKRGFEFLRAKNEAGVLASLRKCLVIPSDTHPRPEATAGDIAKKVPQLAGLPPRLGAGIMIAFVS